MFKKVLALTLAAVMLLMPMTASAVTWNQLVTGLKGNGGSSYTYSDTDNGDTTITYDSMSTTVSGGVLYFEDGSIMDSGMYHFENIDVDHITVIPDGNHIELYLENGAKVGVIDATVENDGYLMVGTMDGSEVTDDVIVYVGDNSGAGVWTQYGSEVKYIDVIVDGQDAYSEVILYGTSDIVFTSSFGENSEIMVDNTGDVNSLYTVAGDGSNIRVYNSGTMNFAAADIYENGTINFNNKKTILQGRVIIEAPSETTYSAEQLLQMVSAVNLNGSEYNSAVVWVETDNTLSIYEIQEDGTLKLVFEEVVEDEEEDEEPEPEPDPIELQRQAEGIGGVTTSPVWNWQGYLGHSSKPMWIYVNGEKVLMRQRLFWLGDSTKNHTCRINVTEPDPASIELRVGLDMLRTAQRAEISVISILDKDSNPIAQFAVSDLLGAFEQYGLVEGELLCVSADPDAEVMKVTLDGEYLPLEEAEEENAAA